MNYTQKSIWLEILDELFHRLWWTRPAGFDPKIQLLEGFQLLSGPTRAEKKWFFHHKPGNMNLRLDYIGSYYNNNIYMSNRDI